MVQQALVTAIVTAIETFDHVMFELKCEFKRHEPSKKGLGYQMLKTLER